MGYSAENISYLKGVLGEKIVDKVVNKKKLLTEEKTAGFRAKKTLEAMEQYGENNRWWLSQDDEMVLRYQVKEPMLIISIEKFIRLINNKLGTEIQNEDELLRDWGSIRKVLGVICA